MKKPLCSKIRLLYIGLALQEVGWALRGILFSCIGGVSGIDTPNARIGGWCLVGWRRRDFGDIHADVLHERFWQQYLRTR
jgi:hypothetical protein